MIDPLILQIEDVDVGIIVGALVVYLLIIGGIGYVGWKRTGNVPEDYYLADRGLGVLVLTATMLATFFSTFAFLGGPGFWYSIGASWLEFGFYNISAVFMMWVVGTRFWLLGKRFGHITPSDLMADFYEDDDFIRILVAVIGIMALIPYATIQLTGVGFAIVGLTGGETPYWMGVAILIGVVAGYIYVGGLRAVAWTDTLQGIIFFIFLIVTAGLAINWGGGLAAGFERAIEVDPNKWTYPVTADHQGSWWSISVVWFVGWVFLPHLWQRMFMARDPRVLAKSALLSGTLSLWVITFMGLIIGGIAAGLIPSLPEGQSSDAIVPILYAEFAPTIGVALVVAAYAAAMSTLGSQILTSSSLFVRDIIKKPFKEDMDDDTESRVGRIFTVVFAVIILAFALSPAGRSAIIPLATDGAALAVLFVPPVLGLFFWEGASVRGTRWSLVIGLIFMNVVIWTPYRELLPYFGPPVWGLVVSAVVYYGVSKVSEPVPMETQRRYREVLNEGMRISETRKDTPDVHPADD